MTSPPKARARAPYSRSASSKVNQALAMFNKQAVPDPKEHKVE